MSEQLPENTIDTLYKEVKQIIEESRNTVYLTANFEMVKAYWNVGQKIVVQEQQGEDRAKYGAYLLKGLSKRLTQEYGMSFSSRNLRYIRQFYNVFPKWNAVRSELSWTHYRLLLKVHDETERTFYLAESITENWSTRTLERQINSAYYKRILATPKENQLLIKQESQQNKEELKPIDFIKDPYVLEFTGLKKNEDYYEKELFRWAFAPRHHHRSRGTFSCTEFASRGIPLVSLRREVKYAKAQV